MGPGVYCVPAPLLRLLDDPAIRKDDITFLHWLPARAAKWSRGPVSFPDGEADGSGCLLRLLPLQAQDYIDYWEADFEKVDPSVIHERFGG
jgi:hypothetical protein